MIRLAKEIGVVRRQRVYQSRERVARFIGFDGGQKIGIGSATGCAHLLAEACTDQGLLTIAQIDTGMLIYQRANTVEIPAQ